MGDFGLTGKSGGTSIFMAPEGLEKSSRVVVKTDLYSFSMTVLFLLLPVDLALKLLFLPIEENWDVFNENLSRFPLLFWIYINSSSDPEARPDFASLNELIEEIRKFEENWLKNKITSEILTENDFIIERNLFGVDVQVFTGCQKREVTDFDSIVKGKDSMTE